MRRYFYLTVLLMVLAHPLASAGPINTAGWRTWWQSGGAGTGSNYIGLSTANLAGAVAVASSDTSFHFAAGTVLEFDWNATPGSGLLLVLPYAQTAATNCMNLYGCGVYPLALIAGVLNTSGPEFEARSTASTYDLTFKNEYSGGLAFIATPNSSIGIRDLQTVEASAVAEPSSWGLVALSLCATYWIGHRNRAKPRTFEED